MLESQAHYNWRNNMKQNIKCFLITFFLIAVYSIHVHASDPMLKWDASTGDVSGYKIYYGLSQGNYPFSEDVGNVTQYSLSNFSLSEGTTYYFVVRAYNASGESGDSNVTTYSVPDTGDTTPLFSPQGVTGEIANNDIVLTWKANSEPDFSVYRVYYGTSSRIYGLPIPVNGTKYSISGLNSNVTYYFAVTAVDTSGNESGYSSPEIQKTIIPVPETDTQEPSVLIESPTSGSSYDTTSSSVDINGTASDDRGVTEVAWSNSKGGSGTATGTSNWSATRITLSEGDNLITVTATDEAGNASTDVLTVVYIIPDTTTPVVIEYPKPDTTASVVGEYTIPDTTTNSWIELTNDNFESGWGNFKDGGRHCERLKRNRVAHQGEYSIKIRKNEGEESSLIYRRSLDIKKPDYSQVKIEFWFLPVGMDKNDKFFVEYYDGKNWQIVARYRVSKNFTNETFYHETGIIINKGPKLTFPENMKIRFRCDANKHEDRIYIDEVIVSAR